MDDPKTICGVRAPIIGYTETDYGDVFSEQYENELLDFALKNMTPEPPPKKEIKVNWASLKKKYKNSFEISRGALHARKKERKREMDVLISLCLKKEIDLMHVRESEDKEIKAMVAFLDFMDGIIQDFCTHVVNDHKRLEEHLKKEQHRDKKND